MTGLSLFDSARARSFTHLCAHIYSQLIAALAIPNAFIFISVAAPQSAQFANSQVCRLRFTVCLPLLRCSFNSFIVCIYYFLLYHQLHFCNFDLLLCACAN